MHIFSAIQGFFLFFTYVPSMNNVKATLFFLTPLRTFRNPDSTNHSPEGENLFRLRVNASIDFSNCSNYLCSQKYEQKLCRQNFHVRILQRLKNSPSHPLRSIYRWPNHLLQCSIALSLVAYDFFHEQGVPLSPPIQIGRSA